MGLIAIFNVGNYLGLSIYDESFRKLIDITTAEIGFSSMLTGTSVMLIPIKDCYLR